MNAEQQRIAIAQACGWHDFNRGGVDLLAIPPNRNSASAMYLCKVPNYPEDLNAMNEAEKALFASRPGYYERAWVAGLCEIVFGCELENGQLDLREAAATAHATAAQRAETFLRTLNLWKE